MQEQVAKTKFYPSIGTKLYLSQNTGNYYVDKVKHPYTVIGYDHGKIIIQSAKLVFSGPRYYDSIPDRIEEDSNGDILKLNWAPKKCAWQVDQYKTGYPSIAHFGSWEFDPYLD